MRINNVMTTPVFSCTTQERLSSAAKKMWENDCGSLPVVDAQGRLVGMITDRDMCMAAFTRGLPLESLDVGSVMAREVFSCTPGASIAEVERLMRQRQVRRVPVVDQAGTLIGIVTLGDLARLMQTKPLVARLNAPRLLRTIASVYRPRGSVAPAVAAE